MYMSGVALQETGKPTGGQAPQAGSPFNLQSIVESIGSVAAIYNQQRLASENIRRLRQGLQPISYQDIPGIVPTVQVEAGVAPQTQQTAMLIFGGLAALAVFAMLRGKKR